MFRMLPLVKQQPDCLQSNIQPEDDKYKSIFTYSSGISPGSSSTDPPGLQDPKRKLPASESSAAMSKYTTAYSKLSKKDDQGSDPGFGTSAFDYKSIFSYSGPERYGFQQQMDHNKPHPSKADAMVAPGVPEKFIAKLALILSYLLVFFTLPISIWFCFKTLPQWERVVVYRLGKLKGVKGPGNIFLIPWLDSYSKLDLRTQLICHPLTQV